MTNAVTSPGKAVDTAQPQSAKGQLRIAVLATNWIGDSVMSLPALRELRRLFPASGLELIARPWVADLYQGQGLVDRLIRIPDGLSLIGRTVWVARKISGADLAILFPNAFVSAIQAVLSGVPDRAGYSSDGRGWLLTRRGYRRLDAPGLPRARRHQSFAYLDLLFQTGLSQTDYLHDPAFQLQNQLACTPHQRDASRRLLKNFGGGRSPRVLLNPGAFFGSAKRWFPERYALLADLLIRELNAEVVLVGSAAEQKLSQHVTELMTEPAILLAGHTRLSDLLGLLADCQLFIGNDSGPMHLAAAVGTPQVALFGSTDEVATGPLSERAVVVHKHVACSPCLLRSCPIDLRCFDRIQVEEVFEEARKLLSC